MIYTQCTHACLQVMYAADLYKVVMHLLSQTQQGPLPDRLRLGTPRLLTPCTRALTPRSLSQQRDGGSSQQRDGGSSQQRDGMLDTSHFDAHDGRCLPAQPGIAASHTCAMPRIPTPRAHNPQGPVIPYALLQATTPRTLVAQQHDTPNVPTLDLPRVSSQEYDRVRPPKLPASQEQGFAQGGRHSARQHVTVSRFYENFMLRDETDHHVFSSTSKFAQNESSSGGVGELPVEGIGRRISSEISAKFSLNESSSVGAFDVSRESFQRGASSQFSATGSLDASAKSPRQRHGKAHNSAEIAPTGSAHKVPQDAGQGGAAAEEHLKPPRPYHKAVVAALANK
jgi:hypothetical protein